MKKNTILLSVATLFLALACNIQEESKTGPAGMVTFKAVMGDDPSTKTVLQSDGSVFWSPGDAISLFYGASRSAQFVSDNTTPSLQANFNGSLEGFLPNGNDEFWAVYPYSEGNAFDGSAVSLTLPDVQEGVEGTFAKDLYISMARSKDYTLQFYNLCGGVKFSVASEGIKYVTFSGNADEVLAGAVKVAFDANGKPQVQSVVNGKKEIRVDAPEGGTFEVGKWYYLVALPATLSAGYTMSFYKDELYAQRITDISISIKRSTWGKLTDADDVGPALQPNNEIWYTSTDGKVVVPNNDSLFGATLISNTYEGEKGVMTFDGPVSMVGDKSYNNSSVSPFNYCANLETISLPESVDMIGYSAFSCCSQLQAVTMPSHLSYMGGAVFEDTAIQSIFIPETDEFDFVNPIGPYCLSLSSISGPYASSDHRCLVFGSKIVSFAPAGLESYTIEEGITEVSSLAFHGCENLRQIVFPSTLKKIANQSFCSCPLDGIVFPEGLEEIGYAAFAGCSALTTITIPDKTRLGLEVFDNCTSLYSFAGRYASEDGRLLVNDNRTLAFAPAGLTEYSIPEGIVSVTDGFYASSALPNLKRLTLPSTLETLGIRAKGLTTLTSYALVPPSMSSSYFLWLPVIEVIYVPASSVDAYKTASYWSEYADRIQPIPGGITASKFLTFTSEGTTRISLANYGGNAPVLYYSTDQTNWTEWDYSELTFTKNLPLYICGDNPKGFSQSHFQYSTFTVVGDSMAVMGDIMSLINKMEDILAIPSSNCFMCLFNGCQQLISAPDLPATILAEDCYCSMFCDCTSLKNAPNLPATTLAKYCYDRMFYGCTSLITAPELPATSLTSMCYHGMFWGCFSLKTAPELPATTLAEECYHSMFISCKSLIAPPKLPATMLTDYCYYSMFSGCENLASPPELPATVLAEGCYYRMFSGCWSLMTSPKLPASSLAKACYREMFFDCSMLNYVKCQATNVSAVDCLTDWLSGVASTGTFVKAPGMNDWPTGDSGIPENWTVINDGDVPSGGSEGMGEEEWN